MHNDRTHNLQAFVDWVAQHVTGDEKGEAQIFLDRLFQAFGYAGLNEAGAKLEYRVKKREDRTSFADLVWKPIVLVEMKRRGVDLSRHYRQAFDYWTRLVPGRPRYVVLCNFDEFWVYDFETQMDVPLDRLSIADLPERYGPLAFLFPEQEEPVFRNDQEAVTREAADYLATCFNHLVQRGVERPQAQRFILQILVALFSEDIGLLDKYLLARLLDDCSSPAESYDLIGGLFAQMNSRSRASGGRFKGVDYFNGGLFSVPARIELSSDEVALLKEAAQFDWSRVRPEIFGTLFEHSLGLEERHAYGAHFTTPADIMKIVGPTIVGPWREQIESAKTIKRLSQLRQRLQEFRVLDPACGSGNFLYIAYREIKRLEALIFHRIETISTTVHPAQQILGFVTAQNFFGIDINPFAVEIAKVTMMLARKLAIDELHVSERALPLDNLDDNFIAEDALINAQGERISWPPADAIIGNPPFLGAKRFKPERGAKYVNAVRKAYPGVPGMADMCVYWFRKAHDHLPVCAVDDPLRGRAGLVGTQNIRNGKSRVGGLDRIVQDGTIIEAVDNQPWSGEANVHVSIVNWMKTQDDALVPKAKKLWSTVDQTPGIKPRRKRGSGPAHKIYDLSVRECKQINSSLSDQADISSKVSLNCNRIPKRCFQGKIPGYPGFILGAKAAQTLSGDSSGVIFPYMTGRDLLSETPIHRWVIDFDQMDIIQASSYPSAFEHCKQAVLPDVEKKYQDTLSSDTDTVEARKEHVNRWWQFWNRRDELSHEIRGLSRYIGCSRVTRRPIMAFLSAGICPSDLVQVFAFSDDYSFGILQSAAHFEWFRKSSRLKVETDWRYSVREVFETFPWPQSVSEAQVNEVAAAGREIRSVRHEALRHMKGGLRAVYRTLDVPGRNTLRTAHAQLNLAVRNAYGFPASGDILAQLLALNHKIAGDIDAGRAATSPGIPPTYPAPSSLVSDDCLRPE